MVKKMTNQKKIIEEIWEMSIVAYPDTNKHYRKQLEKINQKCAFELSKKKL